MTRVTLQHFLRHVGLEKVVNSFNCITDPACRVLTGVIPIDWTSFRESGLSPTQALVFVAVLPPSPSFFELYTAYPQCQGMTFRVESTPKKRRQHYHLLAAYPRAQVTATCLRMGPSQATRLGILQPRSPVIPSRIIHQTWQSSRLWFDLPQEAFTLVTH
jgi:hypothetical protein